MCITGYKDLRCFKKLKIYRSLTSSFLPSLPDGLDCLLSTPCLLLTNRPINFQNSVTVDTGLSDFHKMTLAVMKAFYSKQKPNIVIQRCIWGRSRWYSFRKNNFRRSGYIRLFSTNSLSTLFQTWKYLLTKVMILVSSSPKTKLQTLLLSLGFQVSLW